MNPIQLEPGSFRDRTSRIFYSNGAVFRVLDEQSLKEWETLSSSKFFRGFIAEGKIVGTERVESDNSLNVTDTQNWKAVLRHQTIPFISYPYEWSFGMLKDAALLHADLLKAALKEGMILKDSSAFNIQWNGASPVFIDIGSFEGLRKGEPWVGYRQFCQMFLYPLMLQAYKDINFQPLFRGQIDGFEPEDFNKLMSFRDLFRKGVLLHVFLQAKAQMKYADTRKNVKNTLQSVGFSKELINNNVSNLRKTIEKLSWKRSRSQWSNYMNEHSYSDADHESKKSFVHEVTASRQWNLVWDLGCNTGTFSRIVAENSRYVLAMDTDHLAIEFLYQELKKEGNSKILPLVCNVADPSPNLGWRELERKNLISRGKPDLVVCLALIHHIVISSNIPLNEFIDWLASLESSLIIEFVTKDDPLVRKLLRNKEDQYRDYEKNYFENCLSASFEIIQSTELKSGMRKLYYAKPKEAY